MARRKLDQSTNEYYFVTVRRGITRETMRLKRPHTYALSKHDGKFCVNGEYPRHIYYSRCCLSWFENRFYGGRLKYETNLPDQHDPRTGLTLPHYHAIDYYRRNIEPCLEPPNRGPTTKTHHAIHVEKSSLSSLATELLLQIVAPLVPIHRIFHFSPVSMGSRKSEGVSIHQICQVEEDEDAMISISPIALISRRFKEVVYGLFYGENQFVFEAATVGLTSRISFNRDEMRGISFNKDEMHGLTSWNRARLSSSSISCTHCPLMSTVMVHIKDLTICVSLSQNNLVRSEQMQLLDYIASVSKCFTDKHTHDLRRLTISLAVVEQFHKTNISKQLRLDKGTAWRLRLNRQPRIAAGQKRKRTAQIGEIFQPLESIRGNVQIEIGGLIDMEVATRLRTAMQENYSGP